MTSRFARTVTCFLCVLFATTAAVIGAEPDKPARPDNTPPEGFVASVQRQGPERLEGPAEGARSTTRPSAPRPRRSSSPKRRRLPTA